MLAANSPEWVFTFWGTVDLGAVLVGLNGWWKADEIGYGLRDSGAKVLIADPAIVDAAIIGVPHPILGEEVKAIIQVAPGAAITEEEVRAWVGEKLAVFKVPAFIEMRTEQLLRTPTGKLLKSLLRGQGDGTTSFAEVM